MTRRPDWPAIGTTLDDDDLKSALGASAGARNVVLEQRMREALPTARQGRALPAPVVPAPAARAAAPLRRAAPMPPAPRASQSPARVTGVLVDELERLGDLRARGLVTDEEFIAFKRRLLASR